MITWLKSIPGPLFLLLFPLLVFTCLAVARFAVRRMQGQDRPLPEPDRLSPSEIAVLRGGWELVLKTAIFSLWRRGIIEIVRDEGKERTIEVLGRKLASVKTGGGGSLLKRTAEAEMPADRVEKAVLLFLKTERKPEDFFKDATLKSFVETFCAAKRGELERLRLLKNAGEKRGAWLATLTALFVIYAIGGTKCALGFIHHRPTGFLVLMLIAALPAVLIFMKPYEKTTFLGRAYLKRLEEHFGWLKNELGKENPPGIDPAYALAIFGTAAVAGTLLYASFGEAFPARQTGGCGGGSCGGGSCGGGGCGGGGCGGCGGD